MKNIISKFLDKKCKVDLDLLIDLQCKGHLAKKFYKYIVLDNVTEEVWISKKDSKFLVEFRDSDYSFYCERELVKATNTREKTYRERMNFLMSEEGFKKIMEEHNKDGAEMTKALKKEFNKICDEHRKIIDIYSIIDKKEALESITLNSKRELFKFLNK